MCLSFIRKPPTDSSSNQISSLVTCAVSSSNHQGSQGSTIGVKRSDMGHSSCSVCKCLQSHTRRRNDIQFRCRAFGLAGKLFLCFRADIKWKYETCSWIIIAVTMIGEKLPGAERERVGNKNGLRFYEAENGNGYQRVSLGFFLRDIKSAQGRNFGVRG